MKKIISIGLLSAAFICTSLHADERTITLTDGSVVTGEVISLKNGRYTIKSRTLGVVELDAANVQQITKSSGFGQSADPFNQNGLTESVRQIQEKIANDKELMRLIESLRNNPDIQGLMADPSIKQAIEGQNFQSLQGDQRVQRLMQNQTIKSLQKKIQQHLQAPK